MNLYYHHHFPGYEADYGVIELRVKEYGKKPVMKIYFFSPEKKYVALI